MSLYVSFDDSSNDPTYTFADAALLVEVQGEHDGDNPCVASGARSVPILPATPDEIRLYCQMQGWTVEVREGKLIIDTGVIIATGVQA